MSSLALRHFGASALYYTHRYALSHPISTAVIGCDTVAQLEENVRFASAFSPLTKDEQAMLSEQLSPIARKLMYYKP